MLASGSPVFLLGGLTYALAKFAIASVSGIPHAQLAAGSAPPFISLLGELEGMVVTPYLGAVAARRETERGKSLCG